MKTLGLLTRLTMVMLTAESCDSNQALTPTSGCFSNAPLTTIPWAKDELNRFQQPKSGPLRVVVHVYNQEQFLTFENPVLASPMSHIFDCSGTTIGKRGVNYNDFTSKAKEVAVLLEGRY